ncbi:hypothetical protein PFFVO_06065, partial [Plasmodium falciparum Vietnam Oak-Knoll (FVO)]
MAPGGRGGQGGEDKYKDAKDAKHLLDMIGKDVHEEVKKAAKKFTSQLHGDLSKATYSRNSNGPETPSEPCGLDHKYHTNVTSTVIEPCNKRSRERFPDKEGAQCHTKKIKDNKGKEGACAPYRRLHICDYNLENINDYGNITNDTLLVDVCQAAKFEGESITQDYPKYQAQYASSVSSSQMCTMLARSFADIGDIVRGRDLYLRDKGGKTKLEKNLEKIFEYIKNKNKSTLESLTDKEIREYWWEENRETVWKAITCNAGGNKYFRPTCSEDTWSRDKCHCINDGVPTNFDYVPQYLRWFEEWAEDFCRKKKKKLENLDTQCRGTDASKEPRYCSLNGCDCTKTVRARGKLRYGNRCTDCLFACNPYVHWIDKKKEEFNKQVKKYQTEISGGGASGSSRQRRVARGTTTTKYDGYESKFYLKLQSNGYQTVNAFLEKLSKEDVCTKVQDDKGGKINFKEVNSTSGASADSNSNRTFYHSEYCQPCPYCGMKKKGDNWVAKENDENCKRGNLYTILTNAESTNIDVLSFGDKREDRETKLIKFCAEKNGGVAGGGGSGSNSNSKELYEEWKCYKHDYVKEVGEKDEDEEENLEKVKAAGGLCILKKEKKGVEETNSQKEPDEIQKTFNPFFYYWVAHMLKDSIYWETQKIKKCLKKGTKIKCTEKCKRDCGCFKRWVEQKQTEWKAIKKHFKTQDNIIEGFHDITLKEVLKLEFENKNTEEDKENNVSAEEIDLINKMLKEDETAVAGASGGEDNTTIDKLLKHELDEAKQCIKKCEETQQESVARAEVAGDNQEESEDHGPDDAESDSEEKDDEDDDDGDQVNGPEDGPGATDQEVPGPSVTPTDDVNVCETVAKAFEGKLDDACTLKYVTGKNYGWRCVAPSDTTKTSEGGENGRSRRVARSADGAHGKSDGSICVPPRRRRLYVTPLTRLAGDNTETSQAEGSSVQGTEGSAKPNGQTAEGSQSYPVSSAKALEPVGISSQTSEGKTASHLPNSHPASPSNSRADDLLKAFVESAAVETFFLWDRYKKEWEARHPTTTVGGLSPGVGVGNVDDEDNPQNKLQSGKIPPDFLRQMFYTLGDYRDILVRGVADDKNGGNNIVLEASNDKDKMKEILEKIKEHINNGSKSAVPNPGAQTPNDWWEKNAKHIWKGMVCALTYKTDTSSGEKLTQNEDLKTKLLEKIKEKEGKYHYDQVKLDENSGTGGTKGQTTSASSDTPLLSHFISRPPFFRWLEEWGENFCKERKKRLEKIKDDCKVGENGKKQYSGFGEDCDDQLKDDPTTFKDLVTTCPKSCSSYRKWIERKGKEFDEQQNAFTKQKDKCETESNNHGNGFCVTLKSLSDAASFLEKLKNGPCKKYNESGEDEIKFDKDSKTFQHTKHCDPCSQFKINCKSGNCIGDGTKVKCTGSNGTTTITAEDINGSTDINMLVSDNSGNKFADLQACQHAGIFEGIRKDVWTCEKVCGYVVCKP